MSVAFVADLESGGEAASSRAGAAWAAAEQVETLDENRQVNFDQDAVLFDRVVLKEVGVHEGYALGAFRVLAADFQAILESTKYGMLLEFKKKKTKNLTF